MTFDEQVLELAEKSADAAEAFVHTSSATPVEFEANKLKSIETKVSRSVSLRLIKDGRIGTTSTSRDDDPEAVVASALESSVYGAEARFEFPPLGERTKVDVYDGETPTIPVESMAEAGKQLIARLLEYNPELLIDVSIGKDDEEIRIARYGAAESYRRTGFGVSVSANLIRGTDMLDVYSFNVSCSPDLDTDSLFDEIREKLELARDAGAVESGSIPVVLSPIAFMLTVGPALRMGFNGKMVEQGASPLVGKLGEEVFDPALTIHDDATLQQRPSSSPFDDGGSAHTIRSPGGKRDRLRIPLRPSDRGENGDPIDGQRLPRRWFAIALVDGGDSGCGRGFAAGFDRERREWAFRRLHSSAEGRPTCFEAISAGPFSSGSRSRTAGSRVASRTRSLPETPTRCWRRSARSAANGAGWERAFTARPWPSTASRFRPRPNSRTHINRRSENRLAHGRRPTSTSPACRSRRIRRAPRQFASL